MKAKITFLGGDDQTPGNVNKVTWGEGKDAVTFKVGEPIEVDTDNPESGELDKEIMKRAQGNRFFRVELIPNDTAVPEGVKSTVAAEPVTNIDHSKEAMQTDPLPTDKHKENLAKRDAKQASVEAQRASREVARGQRA